MADIFSDFDFAAFWEDSDYARKEYIGEPATETEIKAVEDTLGYKLPAAYITFMCHQNGGIPALTNHRTTDRTSWAEDHVAITGIFSIGSAPNHSLLGYFGSEFWIREWGYPAIGIYFADCPSAGHDMLCLDYTQCGPQGKPRVVHVDQEWDYKVTHVADSFESFVRALESDDAFE
ncbi:MAG: SMI1/KNR4 family protein [Planctomycetaceae bacterium]